VELFGICNERRGFPDNIDSANDEVCENGVIFLPGEWTNSWRVEVD